MNNKLYSYVQRKINKAVQKENKSERTSCCQLESLWQMERVKLKK